MYLYTAAINGVTGCAVGNAASTVFRTVFIDGTTSRALSLQRHNFSNLPKYIAVSSATWTP
jgi:hypothetical protein